MPNLKDKKPEFRPFDVANYLDSPEMIAEYMAATIEEARGDQALIMNALNTVARAQKRNMSQLAKSAGITRSSLYETLSPRGNPSLSTLLKLVDAMGLRLTFAAGAAPLSGRARPKAAVKSRSSRTAIAA